MRAREGVASRFKAYIEHLKNAVGHADRREPLAAYRAGLLLPGERKSVEPMAARLAPEEVSAKHQSLHHFVAKAPWEEVALLGAARTFVLPIEERALIRAWIIDDTGIPKKGKHSVGVARQYCGELGKQDNRQIAVIFRSPSDHASLPIAYRLYLLENWANNTEQWPKGRRAEDIHSSKPSLRSCLMRFRQAIADGDAARRRPRGRRLRQSTRPSGRGLSEVGLTYIVASNHRSACGRRELGLCPPKTWSGHGRPSLGGFSASGKHKPVTVERWRKALPRKRLEDRSAGAKARMHYSPPASRALRVRPAHRDKPPRRAAWPEEWLLIEWPKGEDQSTKYWLSTLPQT